jgi:hypothetical protein
MLMYLLHKNLCGCWQVMMNFLRDLQEQLGIRIVCSQETEPMDHGGEATIMVTKVCSLYSDIVLPSILR